MSNIIMIEDDEVTPRTDAEWADHVETKKLLAQAALDGTFKTLMDSIAQEHVELSEQTGKRTNEEIDSEIEQVLVEAGIDPSVEPSPDDYDRDKDYWEAHAAWANEKSGATARHQAEVAAILGVEFYGKK